jgi:putative flippase GtrA
MTATSFADPAAAAATAATAVPAVPAVPVAPSAPVAPVAGRGAWGEFIRYFGCSAVALAADAGVYTACMKLLGWGYASAAAVGFVTGLVIVYVLSVRLAFRTRRLADARAEFTLFAAIGAFGLVLTEALLWALVDGLDTEPVVARFLAAGLVFVANFSLRKLVLFSRRTAGDTHV